MAAAPVLRDGEVPFDHSAADAPEHGPLTAGADMLTALSFDQLRCLHARMNTVRADYSVLRSSEDWREPLSAPAADLEATWDEATALMNDVYAAWAVVLRKDGAR